ncbi:MAG TPA: hypothetical protein VGI75_02910, partial [Pirellulales bacterium]
GQARWAGLFLFLFAYWAALLIQASFDVYLEGPVGGLWFWTITGVGIAAAWLHRYQSSPSMALQAAEVDR